MFQFYGPGNAYHSLLLDAGDTDYVAYDPTRFYLVVRKPLYDKLVRYVLLHGCPAGHVILRPHQWWIQAGRQGPPLPRGPNSFIFIQFSATILQNNRFVHCPRKYWIHHCQ